MYRKIMGFLEAWKENEHRKPLILQGARQVGKTYSILEFGRIHYENVAYFNFETNPVKNGEVTVYKVDANGRTRIVKTVSNAGGQVCFPITETATYVLEY